MNIEDVDADILAGFLDEAGQCVEILNEKLLEVEAAPETAETVIQEMFRAAHSMKGAAGFLGLMEVSSLTHSLETVLDAARKDNLEMGDAVIESLFQACDLTCSLLADISLGTMGEVDIAPMVSQLESLLSPPEDGVEGEEGDPEVELGPMPAWLKEELTFDDVLEGIIAKNSGEELYGLLFSLKDILQHSPDPLGLYHKIESAVSVLSVYPLVHDQSLWEPMARYGMDIGLFCSSSIPISQALESLSLPKCQAWMIGEQGHLGEPIVLSDGSEVDLGEPTSELAMRPELNGHKSLWISETREELEQLDLSLMSYEKQPSREDLNELFRLMHRIKGSSAHMGLKEMSRVAHNCETLLDSFREQTMEPNEESFKVLFAVKDFLWDCLNRIESNETSSPEASELDACFESILALVCNEQQTVFSNADSFGDELLLGIDEALAAGKPVWKVDIQLQPETPLPDIRYGMILKNLENQFEVLSSRPTFEELERGIDSPPPLMALLCGIQSKKDIQKVLQFDMVKQYEIEEIKKVSGKKNAPSTVPVPPVSPPESQSSEASTESPIQASPQTDSSPAPAEPVSVAVPKKAAPADKNSALVGQSETIRVDTARLDSLMNIAGELVITKARVTQLTENMGRQFENIDFQGLENLLQTIEEYKDAGRKSEGDVLLYLSRFRNLKGNIQELKNVQDSLQKMKDTTIELHRHTSSMQNNVMQIRMVPIGPLFKRFHRLVRDLCKDRGRIAVLTTSGENTELDKKLIDELTDPLTHLIRNGMDHGLESPEERVQAGKPEQGTVRLEAFHESSQICIRVSDDGKGLDVEKIKAKAMQNGIISSDQAQRMPDDEAYNLIFQPGFSTAAQVTSVSGRGVGMDIVRSKVAELKGKIDITSTLGKGTVFTIRLPLTLAMIEALLVQIGNTCYAMPLEGVREIVDVEAGEIKSIEGKGRVIFLRSEYISLLDLSETVDLDPLLTTTGTLRAVVSKGVGEPMAIAVDRVIGDEEIVVKSLGDEFGSVRGISGAAVLGDGQIALILDLMTIRDMTRKHSIFTDKQMLEV